MNVRKNLEILSAISGDSVSRKRVIRKFKYYANSVASELFSDLKLQQYAQYKASEYFSDPVFRENAVWQALDKVEDWINDKRNLYVQDPYSYAKRIVSNELIQIARQRELNQKKLIENQNYESREINSGLGPQNIMAAVGGYAKIVVRGNHDDDEDNDCEGYGFRVFKESEDPSFKVQPEDSKISQIHPWIEKLEKVIEFDWWVGEDFAGSVLEFNKQTNRLWGKYNFISALIDSVTSSSEKRVLLLRLWGFKSVRISEEMRVSKAYVSKVLSKWMTEWDWNDDDIAQAQLTLLTKQLADWYYNYFESIPRMPEDPKYPDVEDSDNPNIDDLYGKLSQREMTICESESLAYSEFVEYRKKQINDEDNHYDSYYYQGDKSNLREFRNRVAKAKKYQMETRKYNFTISDLLAEIEKPKPPSAKDILIQKVQTRINSDSEVKEIYKKLDNEWDKEYKKIIETKEEKYNKALESYGSQIKLWLKDQPKRYFNSLNTSPYFKAYFSDLNLSGVNHFQLPEIIQLKKLLLMHLPDELSTRIQISKLENLNELMFIAEVFNNSWYPKRIVHNISSRRVFFPPLEWLELQI